MNTILSIDSASGAVAANQAPRIISAMVKAEQSATEPISGWKESWLRFAPVILQGSVAVFAALYLFGVFALGAALLFYTFAR
ncbi:MAG: hypothetical protein WB586_20290 [Chthoniobacterales bacterium]